MFYAFYIFDSAKVIFFSMIYTLIVLKMYVYIDKSNMLYVFYIFDSAKVIFLV